MVTSSKSSAISNHSIWNQHSSILTFFLQCSRKIRNISWKKWLSVVTNFLIKIPVAVSRSHSPIIWWNTWLPVVICFHINCRTSTSKIFLLTLHCSKKTLETFYRKIELQWWHIYTLTLSWRQAEFICRTSIVPGKFQEHLTGKRNSSGDTFTLLPSYTSRCSRTLLSSACHRLNRSEAGEWNCFKSRCSKSSMQSLFELFTQS